MTEAATPQEVAGRIAAIHCSEPARSAAVKMVGTQEVEKFIARILEAQKQAREQVLSLD